MNWKREPRPLLLPCLLPTAGQRWDGLEMWTRERLQLAFSLDQLQVKSYNSVMLDIPSWARKWIQTGCWNQHRFYSKPLVLCLLSIPQSHFPVLLHKPTSTKDLIADQSSFSLLSRQVPFTSPAGTLDSGISSILLLIPSQTHLLFSATSLSQHTFALLTGEESSRLNLHVQNERSIRWTSQIQEMCSGVFQKKTR